MTKALFFDIDGTLVSFKTHRIPDSTVEALTRAKERGLEIYISTGRPYAIINNIDPIKHLVNGYVTANGAYCFAGDREISCSPILPEDVDTLLRLARERDFACMVVGVKDLTMYNPNDEARYIFHDLLNVGDCLADAPLSQVLAQPILQLTPVISEATEREIRPLLRSVESGRWYPSFTDFTAGGVSKAKGLAEVAAFRGFSIGETMAFGDGGNDLPIVRAAGIGVAMGNGGEHLREAADYVTTSVDEDGIANALRHFNLI